MEGAMQTMDFDKARFNMVEQQVRPWDVLDQSVLDLLLVVRREEFVPPAFRALAFADMELPLRIDGVDSGETMWAPKLEARIVQELAPKRQDMVLEIGTGSGYLTSRGWASRAPYDVIVATGSLPVVPEALRQQLRIGGRLAAVVGTAPVMSAQLITRVSEAGFDTVKLFETQLKPLRHAETPSSFRF